MTNRPAWEEGDRAWRDRAPRRPKVRQIDHSGLLITGDAAKEMWERQLPILKGMLMSGAGDLLSEDLAGKVCDVYGGKIGELTANSRLTLGGFGKSMRAFEKKELVEELAFLDPTLVEHVIGKCVDARRMLEQNMGKGLSPARGNGMRK